jgi:hypothetical protein
MTAARGLACLVLLIAASGTPAAAQTAETGWRRVTVRAGASWIGAATYGTTDANLTTPTGGTQVLFSSTNRIGWTTAFEGGLTVRVTRRFSAEATGTFGHGDLRASISGDFEGAPAAVATDRLALFTVEGGGLWHFRRRGRFQPFARAGAGWMRQLSSDGVLAADGSIVSAGGGIKYWWRERSKGALKRLGLRSDLRAVARSGGLAFGPKTRVFAPAAALSVIIGF